MQNEMKITVIIADDHMIVRDVITPQIHHLIDM